MTGSPPAATAGQRCAIIAVVGAPNAGKSTLVNALVGAKVAIVSHKVQTTRARLMGVAMAEEAQLILIDTPGIFSPRRRLERAMVAAAWAGAAEADMVLFLVDAKRGLDGDAERILDGLAGARQPVLLVLNKVDLLGDKKALLSLARHLHERHAFAETFMVSARDGDGVATLKRHLAAHAPDGPWLFPEDQLCNLTARMMAAEITREQVYGQLHQELPYAITVETEAWEARPDGSARLAQVIFVERESQKGIVIGKGGARLKAIGVAARAAMEEAFGHRVHLALFVKVDPHWAESRARYQAMGLDWVD
ncbi:MAG: GTPase Era [Pseudomonadota bacterium]